MNLLFYITAVAAIISTCMVIVGKNAVHSLLYLIVSLLAVSVIFFLLGAPFVAALEVIIYAGAIMVLFVFVIMMLNLSGEGVNKEHELLRMRAWWGPSFIVLGLLVEMFFALSHQNSTSSFFKEVSAEKVGELMFTKYILLVELSGFLLTSGIIGAYHLGEKEMVSHHRYLKKENQQS